MTVKHHLTSMILFAKIAESLTVHKMRYNGILQNLFAPFKKKLTLQINDINVDLINYVILRFDTLFIVLLINYRG